MLKRTLFSVVDKVLFSQLIITIYPILVCFAVLSLLKKGIIRRIYVHSYKASYCAVLRSSPHIETHPVWSWDINSSLLFNIKFTICLSMITVFPKSCTAECFHMLIYAKLPLLTQLSNPKTHLKWKSISVYRQSCHLPRKLK